MLALVLLMVVAIGMFTLASIELRRSERGDFAAIARANARLALTEAIGQLQRSAGPDQRVTATAEILGDRARQPQWAGVWRSTLKDGSPVLKRDDMDGGLRDVRSQDGVTPQDQVMEWLVSGKAAPTDATIKDSVTMVGKGSTGDAAAPSVEVPKLEVTNALGDPTGHYAWWTGDLGVRANVSTHDPRAATPASTATPADGGMFRVMASQSADIGVTSGGVDLAEGEERRLASSGTASLSSAGPGWSRDHAFDFTVDSRGVLADVANGGLKRDLTAYLLSSGSIPEKNGIGGISDDDSLVGEAADLLKTSAVTRHQMASPRFGVLRNWARSTTAFNEGQAAAQLQEMDTRSSTLSRSLALANETAVKLAGNKMPGLQPVLVEATNFTQMSSYVHVTTGTTKIYQIRQLMYPRVVLWNPYNVRLKADAMIAMIQGNGRQEMWTENVNTNNLPWYAFSKESQWLMFEGGRSTAFGASGGIMSSQGYNDPYMGSYYFSIPATTFAPGECLVFSPAKAAEYDGLSAYRPGSYNLANNLLTCNMPPDPGRSYYVSASEIDGGINFLPVNFWYAPTPYWSQAGKNGVENQSDDTRVILKSMGTAKSVTFEEFDALPQIAVNSASLQYGAGREPRISWNGNERMPIQLLDRDNPRPTVVPNVRTREGIRLRWFEEHPSNKLNSGPLTNTPHFEEALLANWNPRASYIMRSPWENIAGTLPVSGKGGGPWFFGAYTRDLFDQAVSWDEQVPVPSGGRYHGNPFGTPQEGTGRYVLFDVPRNETGVVSLAQFQHAKISDLIWHPSNAIGNSLADPRLGRGGFSGLGRTAATSGDADSAGYGGFHETDLGWSSDAQRSGNRSEWATNARAMLEQTPEKDNLVYDLSFETNRSLWDRYYLSTGTAAEKGLFLTDPEKNPLPNARMQLAPTTRKTADEESLGDFHQAAYHLMVDGAFNVNSTRVEAWKALLASTRRSGYGKDRSIPFPRVLSAPGGAWKSGDMVDGDEAWAGHRELSESEIGTLAEAIVQEVKLRGPFLSLSDFVNRRLAEDETGKMGTLQAAIERANLNQSLIAAYPLDNGKSLPDYQHPDNISDATRLEQMLKPSSKAWGAPAYLTQADVLQVIGPALSARSDSFVIRAYGDAVDGGGVIQARAWCEAVVQRTPEPVKADESGMNPVNPGQPGDFGRRFGIASFRWLGTAEI